MKSINFENLRKSNEVLKTQYNLTDEELFITNQDFNNPNNPYPQSIVYLGHAYIEDPTDDGNDLWAFYIQISPDQPKDLQINQFKDWLWYIFDGAYPNLTVTHPETYNPYNYLIIASQFC